LSAFFIPFHFLCFCLFSGTKFHFTFKFNPDSLRLRAENDLAPYKLSIKSANLFVRRLTLKDNLAIAITNKLTGGELATADFQQSTVVGPFQFQNVSEFTQQVFVFVSF